MDSPRVETSTSTSTPQDTPIDPSTPTTSVAETPQPSEEPTQLESSHTDKPEEVPEAAPSDSSQKPQEEDNIMTKDDKTIPTEITIEHTHELVGCWQGGFVVWSTTGEVNVDEMFFFYKVNGDTELPVWTQQLPHLPKVAYLPIFTCNRYRWK